MPEKAIFKENHLNNFRIKKSGNFPMQNKNLSILIHLILYR